MLSLTRKTIVLWNLFLLATRVCWEHSRSLPTSVRQVVLTLTIGWQSPRKILFTSGAVVHVCMPLKGMTPLLLLPCLPLFPRVLLLLVDARWFQAYWWEGCLAACLDWGALPRLEKDTCWSIGEEWVPWDSRCSSHEPDWKRCAYFLWCQWCYHSMQIGPKGGLCCLKLFSCYLRKPSWTGCKFPRLSLINSGPAVNVCGELRKWLFLLALSLICLDPIMLLCQRM